MIVLTPGTPRTLALARRMGTQAVCLVEADGHDAARMRDLLARAGLDVAVTTDRLPGAVQVRDAGAVALPPAPLVVHLGGGVPGPGRAVVDLSAPDLALAEVLEGSDPAALDLLAALGIPVLTVPAFLAPRILMRIEDAVESLVFDGSTPWEVDAAAETLGFTLGPCAAMDQRGLSRRARALPLVNRMVDEGRHGRAAGVGWYRYPGGGGRVIDPLIEDMAREEAHFAGQSPRSVPDAEIRARLLAALGDPPEILARALGLPLETPCP